MGLASNYKTLFIFDGRNGAIPAVPLAVLKGTLYGTTFGGGGAGCGRSGCGTVFGLPIGGKQRVLYRFGGSSQTFPSGLTVLNGTLYGTTNYGGTGCGFGCGTIFSVTPAGKERVVYRFKATPDGQYPNGLTALNDTLYGTTYFGGSSDRGAVYSLTAGKERVFYSFKGGSDGALPAAPLTVLNGTFYGTTSAGGSGCSGYGCGTVFSITTAGEERVLYSFPDIGNVVGPQPGVLTALNGVLYGTTYYGGTGGSRGCGTVFSITTAGVESVLYNFNCTGVTVGPSGLTVLNGALYGTTQFGGSADAGTIFRITTAGNESVLYNFEHPGGVYPEARLTRLKGTLYGTTTRGGSSHRDGTVFAFTP
jgi:uncharacterized repeat protein (TIGR03803 family)